MCSRLDEGAAEAALVCYPQAAPVDCLQGAAEAALVGYLQVAPVDCLQEAPVCPQIVPAGCRQVVPLAEAIVESTMPAWEEPEVVEGFVVAPASLLWALHQICPVHAHLCNSAKEEGTAGSGQPLTRARSGPSRDGPTRQQRMARYQSSRACPSLKGPLVAVLRSSALAAQHMRASEKQTGASRLMTSQGWLLVL